MHAARSDVAVNACLALVCVAMLTTAFVLGAPDSSGVEAKDDSSSSRLAAAESSLAAAFASLNLSAAASASASASALESLDLSASAAALGVSESALAARGLAPENCPHNITRERRDRRELNELEGWMDARATWYGGPGGPGPDGMSIYTGSCGYGVISNHFISAWRGPSTALTLKTTPSCFPPNAQDICFRFFA